jgi:hypothetical protein
LTNNEGDRRFHISEEDLSEAAHALMAACRRVTNGAGVESGFDFSPKWAIAAIFGAVADKINNIGQNGPDFELVVGNPPLRECGCRGLYGCYAGGIPGWTLNMSTGCHERALEVGP